MGGENPSILPLYFYFNPFMVDLSNHPILFILYILLAPVVS